MTDDKSPRKGFWIRNGVAVRAAILVALLVLPFLLFLAAENSLSAVMVALLGLMALLMTVVLGLR